MQHRLTRAILFFCAIAPLAKGAEPIPSIAANPPDWVWTDLNQVFSQSMSDDALTSMAAAGVEVLHTGFPPREPAEKWNAFKQSVDKAHEHGIKVVAGGSLLYFQFDILREHPDWRVHWVDDPPLVANWKFDEHPKIRACLNSPYREFIIKQLADIALESGVDGYSFDGSHQELCYCKYCKEKYRAATGKEIPTELAGAGRTDGGDLAKDASGKLDLSNPDIVRYFRWREQTMMDFWQAMRAALRAVNPDFGFLTWTINAGRWGHLSGVPRSQPFILNRLFDVPMQEWWFEETNRGASITVPGFGAALIRATAEERPSICNPYDFTHWEDLWQAGYGSSMPFREREFRMLLAITHGSIPAGIWGPPYKASEAAPLIKLVRDRQQWLVRERSLKYAALVVSDDTRNFYGGKNPIGRYIEHCLGVFRALNEAHLPVDIICDWDLDENRLAEYKVVILANTACLSDQAVENLRAYVHAGGGLVSTVESSRYTQDGVEREDFALGDVFGAHFVKMAEELASTSGMPGAPMPIAEAGAWDSAGATKGVIDWRDTAPQIVDAGLKELAWSGAGFAGKCAVVGLKDTATTAATIRLLTTVNGYPGGSNLAPASVVVNHPGKGRSVYFAAGIDQGYYAYPYPYQRMLIANAVRWAADEAPPVRIEAPMALHAGFFQQTDDKGQRTIVHLLNTINSTGGAATPGGSDVPLREEVVPLHDVAVTFAGEKPSHVHLEPGGGALATQQVADGWRVVVPKLEVQSMVVAEYGPAQ